MNKLFLKVLILTKLGFSTKEISQLLDIPRSTAFKKVKEVKKRFYKKNKEYDFSTFDLFLNFLNTSGINIENIFKRKILEKIILSKKFSDEEIENFTKYSEEYIKKIKSQLTREKEGKDTYCPWNSLYSGIYKECVEEVYIECMCYTKKKLEYQEVNMKDLLKREMERQREEIISFLKKNYPHGLTVNEFVNHFDLNKRSVRKAIGSGKIQARKRGKGYIISTEAIAELMDFY